MAVHLAVAGEVLLVSYFVLSFLNDILHISFLAGIHVFKAFPAYTTTEL